MNDATVRVGVDIGGTFTDVVELAADGRVALAKVPSTTDDYARGIIETLAARFGSAPAELAEIVHGTTVASNAILEGTGARAGLITTRGFRDVLEIRRLRYPRLYDPTWQKPPPLIERALRVEVDERMSYCGEVRRPLDLASLAAAVERLRCAQVEAIAVCLLHSYANPAHEQAIAAYLREVAPELPVSVSSELLPEIREYERTSTTAINAYVTPVVRRYLRRLVAGLADRGLRAPLRIMQSNGGTMSAETATGRPMLMIESGPAAGVVGGAVLARQLGLPNLITLDIGGTTAKAGMVENGAVHRAAEYEVGGGIIGGSRLLKGAGYLLRAPAIDLAEVGAGGGSLLWIDRGGALQIGPQSAGAVPGPVCYGRGGTEPTLTDAHLVLGYLHPEWLAGGAVRVNADLARRVLDERIARPLGMSLAEAAYGAHRLAAATMLRAIKAVSSERGRHPRDYLLVAFGGNGPTFAATMARALGMRRVLIPPAPGLFSSFGLLLGDCEQHLAQGVAGDPRGLTAEDLNRQYAALAVSAQAQLLAEGFPPERVEIQRQADLHYRGQSFELTVPVAGGPLDPTALATMEAAFAAEHERTYGHRAGGEEPIELVTLRLIARGIPERPPQLPDFTSAPAAGDVGAPREVYLGREAGWRQVSVVRRAAVGLTPQPGPLLVEEFDSTTLVPPDATIWRDQWGNLRLEIGLGVGG
jgi:N-methylhydantoinase A